jgi:DNA replication licensing factor MCM6
VAIYNLPKVDKVRDLKTANLGKIMSIEGTVTRTTDVKPELSIGTFRCKVCETDTDGIEQQFKFTKPVKCKS